ncbi:TolC family protein, partial [Klebsiella pneumoniae]|uniref:TolC family protein n=1 Tax=Klebsiella pneumoniae TaxID=573 RepID=UPI002159F714
EWVHVQLHQQKGMISLSPPTICNSALQITLQRARGLYASGAVSYIEVLDAERSLFATQQTILDLTYSRQVNEINLFTALGGGWVE